MAEEYQYPRHFMGAVSDRELGQFMLVWLSDRYVGCNITMVEEPGRRPYAIYCVPIAGNTKRWSDTVNYHAGEICSCIRAFEAGWQASAQLIRTDV